MPIHARVYNGENPLGKRSKWKHIQYFLLSCEHPALVARRRVFVVLLFCCTL